VVAATSVEWDEEEEPTAPFWRSGARVVVVDDDSDMRQVVHTTLRREGYDIRENASGGALLRTLSDIALGGFPLDGVDLIVLDNRMPGITGLEALRAIRGSEWTTPAVLMTAYPSQAVSDEAQALGAVVLPKPFTREALTRVVLEALLGKNRPRRIRR
jgi:CheY-like chemotaxis protein